MANEKWRRKSLMDIAVLRYLRGNLLGSSPAIIRYYVARHTFGYDHHDSLPHQTVRATITRLHKDGKICEAMGGGWIIDPKGPVGHHAHPSRIR